MLRSNETGVSITNVLVMMQRTVNPHPAAPRIATVTTCRYKQAWLLFAKDDISERRYLIDTGALVFPVSELDTRSHHSSALLEAAKGSVTHMVTN